jgi:hypothetical protein
MCCSILVARLWWQEPWLGRMMELGISPNKVVFPVFWRLVVLILFCDFR